MPEIQYFCRIVPHFMQTLHNAFLLELCFLESQLSIYYLKSHNNGKFELIKIELRVRNLGHSDYFIYIKIF